jgi:hypothetical protein
MNTVISEDRMKDEILLLVKENNMARREQLAKGLLANEIF